MRWAVTQARGVRAFLLNRGPTTLTISGTSMYPRYKAGQTVPIADIQHRKLVPGRCYVYVAEGRMILHRFVGHRGDEAIFLGDNSLSVESVRRGEIIGEPIEDEVSRREQVVRVVDRVVLPFLVHTETFLRVRRWLTHFAYGVRGGPSV